jgi:flagellar protein FliJ
MSRAWVSTLLRARQAQEDVARGRLADAHRHAQQAHARLLVEGDRLESMSAEHGSASALAFIAAASAQQSAAATWFAARHAHASAEDQLALRSSALTAAAQERRGVEKLAERDAAEARTRAGVAQQKELDEVGGRVRAKQDAG